MIQSHLDGGLPKIEGQVALVVGAPCIYAGGRGIDARTDQIFVHCGGSVDTCWNSYIGGQFVPHSLGGTKIVANNGERSVYGQSLGDNGWSRR